MTKYEQRTFAFIGSIFLLFSTTSQAVLAPEKFDTTYCVVPVLGEPNARIGQRGIDFFGVYPIPPYVLVNDKFGSLWTIKGFNDASVYTPEIELTYFDASIYSLKNNAVYVYDPLSWKYPGPQKRKLYKFHGNNYPEAVEKEEFLKLGDVEKILHDQYQKNKTIVSLKSDSYLASRDQGIFLVYPSGKAIPLLGSQLVRPNVEFCPMADRGDILVNAWNGLFILSENKGEVTAHCNNVRLIHAHQYKLTPLLTNITNDVIIGAHKFGEKYLIDTQDRNFWLYDHGKIKKLEQFSEVKNVASSENEISKSQYSERNSILDPFLFRMKNNIKELDRKRDSNFNFYGEVISEIPNTNSYLLAGHRGGLEDLAVLDSNANIKMLSEPNSWALGVSEPSKKDIRYLFENGFFSISGNKLHIKNFPHLESWDKSWIKHIHPDKENPKNTILFEGSKGGAFKVNSQGKLEKLNSFPIADTQQIGLYYSDNEILYFIYQNKVMRWSEKDNISEIAQLDLEKYGKPKMLMMLGEKLIVASAKGAFNINKNGTITTYLADLYRLGPISKIEPLPNLQAYLITGNYGLYVVDQNETASRLHLEGRENEFFSGNLVYDGIESYIRTSTGIYRIDTITSARN